MSHFQGNSAGILGPKDVPSSSVNYPALGENRGSVYASCMVQDVPPTVYRKELTDFPKLRHHQPVKECFASEKNEWQLLGNQKGSYLFLAGKFHMPI